MDNNKFWEQYKAKCLEKGLPVLHESEEDFSKAMSEPPKPFSTDDITSLSTREHIDFKKSSQMWNEIVDADDIDEDEEDTMPKHVKWERYKECGEMKEDSDFGHNRDGSLKKICKACHGRKISEARKGNVQKPHVEEKVIDLKDVKPYENEARVCIPDEKPYYGADIAHDASDAIAFALHVNTPMVKERKPLKAMSEEALRNLLRLAFLAGVESVNTPEPEEVTQETAMELLNDVISQCKGARA